MTQRVFGYTGGLLPKDATAVSWQTFGSGGFGDITVVGDSDWGQLTLGASNDEARSAVYDLTTSASRTFSLNVDYYGSGHGSGNVTIQIRGDTSSFSQNDILPAWETYASPISRSWRYVQIRATTSTGVYYYVDATGGSDSDDGLTPDTAWQTLTKVNSVSYNPGDVILFKRGETFSGSITIARSGARGNKIIYGAYGSGARPIINGSAAYALHVSVSYSWLAFYSIDFAGATGTSIPTVRANSHDLYFYDCIFRDSAAYIGFVSYSSSGAEIYNVTVVNCTATGNYKTGFYCSSGTGVSGPTNVLFYNCTAYSNGNDIYADHGFYVGFGVIVDNCISYSNSSAGFKVNSNLAAGSPYAPIVRNCTSYNNADGLYVGHYNAIFYNNLVYSNTDYNINFDSEGDNCKFFFNTFVNSTDASKYAVDINPSVSTGNVFKNNIFIQDSAVVTNGFFAIATTIDEMSVNNIFDFNVYYFNGNTSTPIMWQGTGSLSKNWTQWIAASGLPEDSGTYLSAVPDFVTRYTDFHPSDGGNLKGLGVYMLDYPTDKDGNARSNPPTPGCYEEASA